MCVQVPRIFCVTASDLCQVATRLTGGQHNSTFLLDIKVCMKSQMDGKKEEGYVRPSQPFLVMLGGLHVIGTLCCFVSHLVHNPLRAYLALAIKIGLLKFLSLAFSVI